MNQNISSTKKVCVNNPVLFEVKQIINRDILEDHGFKLYFLDRTDSTWVACLPNFYRPSETDFQQLWEEHPREYTIIKIFGKDTLIPRYQQAYGQSYHFSGTVSDAVPETKLITDMKNRINDLLAECGLEYHLNMCLCNWYEPQHYIGPHSDDIRQLLPDSPIASVSWGYTRRFCITPRRKDGEERSLELDLNNGDLVIMGGKCQVTHKHEIKKLKKSELSSAGNRINFTFRCFA